MVVGSRTKVKEQAPVAVGRQCSDNFWSIRSQRSLPAAGEEGAKEHRPEEHQTQPNQSEPPSTKAKLFPASAIFASSQLAKRRCRRLLIRGRKLMAVRGSPQVKYWGVRKFSCRSPLDSDCDCLAYLESGGEDYARATGGGGRRP